MKPPLWFLLGLAAATLALGGCSRHEHEDNDHDHAAHVHDHGGADETGGEGEVAFIPGRGLRLSAAITGALGLQTVVVAEQMLAPEQPVTVQVYATAPRVLASARLPAAHAAEFAGAAFTGARLVQIDRSAATATPFVDVLFELTAGPPHQPGDFVTLALVPPAASALAVPRTAVLDGAEGSFVYLVEDGLYRRVPVQTGPRAGALVGITTGLRAGDCIVSTAVDQLWLAELRLTKGGGHSH